MAWHTGDRVYDTILAIGFLFVGITSIAAWFVDSPYGRFSNTKLGLRTFTSYDRIAVVTDATWMRRAVAAFGWMIPGEVRVFHVSALDAARTWITG